MADKRIALPLAPRRAQFLEKHIGYYMSLAACFVAAVMALAMVISCIGLLVSTCQHIGPDNGDEMPWPSILFWTWLPVTDTALFFYIKHQHDKWLVDYSTYYGNYAVEQIRDWWREILASKNSQLIDAGRGVVQDLEKFRTLNLNRHKAANERVDVLQELAREARALRTEHVIDDTNLEAARIALESSRAVRKTMKELSP